MLSFLADGNATDLVTTTEHWPLIGRIGLSLGLAAVALITQHLNGGGEDEDSSSDGSCVLGALTFVFGIGAVLVAWSVVFGN